MLIKKNIRNIGIFAHVDAGKTTLTENILYVCGSIRKVGRVDQGTAHTDTMNVERERGISVKAAEASVNWKGTRINIIDTPGHVDFSAEVERSITALDGAILVISAVEGVQSQSEIIFKALKQTKIPTVIFINKIDRIGADITKVMEQIQLMTGGRALCVEIVTAQSDKDSKITSFYEKNQDKLIEGLRNHICEFLAEYDDNILEKIVLGQSVSTDEMQAAITKLSSNGDIFPVFDGTALRGIGVQNILDGIINYLPEPSIEGYEDVTGVAYKIYRGVVGGKAVHTRLYEGSVKVRGTVHNYTRNIEEKITGIFKVNGSEYEAAATMEAGEIGILYGLNNTKSGDVLGSPKNIKKKFSIASPTLTVQAFPKMPEQLDNVVYAFRILEEEDPLLNVQWLDNQRELHVQLMGMVQMEILTKIIKDRFNLDVIFQKPSVVYKESPKGVGIGYVDMTTPYYAALKMMVEPLKRGSGYIYESTYTTDFVFKRFQNEVEETVPKVLTEGLYGWEVIDVKVTLIGGRSINLATKPSDFRAVTPIAVMDAIKQSGTIILEPIQEYEVNFDKGEAGTVIKDLLNMRAELIDQVIIGDNYIIKGIIPVATSVDYPVRIASLSKGRSTFKTRFIGYKECPFELAKIRQRSTADPSDRERYLQSISAKNTRDKDAYTGRE